MYVLSSLLASSRSFGADKSESLCNHPCDYKSSKTRLECRSSRRLSGDYPSVPQMGIAADGL